MHYFQNDYNLMCHPMVMDRLTEAISTAMPGYGTDECCASAAKRIRQLCQEDTLAVHFLVGGTQANLTVIDAALRPHQAVVSAHTGHIHVHETGAVEATGHKILALASDDGKITSKQVEELARAHLDDADKEHTAQPKMVYISNPTELGTIYSLAELQALSEVCKKYGYYLFMDGARLGYGLAARDNDVTLRDLAMLTDVFYIGGTKQGALFGEAVVISNPVLAEDFRYLIKQHGGMLAKGWLLGVQFEALLKDNLYFEASRHANELADLIRQTLDDLGYPQRVKGTTNQVFPILPDSLLKELGKTVMFCEMGRFDQNHRIVRFCTSWGTNREDVEYLCQLLRDLSK